MNKLVLEDAPGSKFYEGIYEIRQGATLRARIERKGDSVLLRAFYPDGNFKGEAEFPNFTPDLSYASARELAQAFSRAESVEFIDQTTRGQLTQSCLEGRAYAEALRK